MSRTKIIRIGNSKGIRIPKVILDEMDLHEEETVDIIVADNAIIISPISQRRFDWDKQFAQIAEKDDDYLLYDV
ncbi:MAG: AbrB/MazE/SpoVT family DNA-binding domain-containing protein, partial [Anaerolineaceae bacterium]|nr:AbrB/MazE/SpoVT family DNA-binding domain-containing protein [Anaerolineaceae bacterium]